MKPLEYCLCCGWRVMRLLAMFCAVLAGCASDPVMVPCRCTCLDEPGPTVVDIQFYAAGHKEPRTVQITVCWFYEAYQPAPSNVYQVKVFTGTEVVYYYCLEKPTRNRAGLLEFNAFGKGSVAVDYIGVEVSEISCMANPLSRESRLRAEAYMQSRLKCQVHGARV